MRRVLKYPLPRHLCVPGMAGGKKVIRIMMAAHAEIVKVAMQHGDPTIWALVDERPPTSPVADTRTFWVAATGEWAHEGLAYVGTVFDGDYVWHIFEERT